MNETEPSLTSLKVYPDHNTVFQNTVPVVLEEILIYVSKHVLKTTAPHTDRQTKKQTQNKHTKQNSDKIL
jgi:hypothetical protein